MGVGPVNDGAFAQRVGMLLVVSAYAERQGVYARLDGK